MGPVSGSGGNVQTCPGGGVAKMCQKKSAKFRFTVLTLQSEFDEGHEIPPLTELWGFALSDAWSFSGLTVDADVE